MFVITAGLKLLGEIGLATCARVALCGNYDSEDADGLACPNTGGAFQPASRA